MKITEIMDPKCHPDNPKALINETLKRKCKSFKTIKGLARYSRNHFHFVHTQDVGQGPRQNKICTKLNIGSHLLWLDLDFDVDIEDLKKRFRLSGLKGFFYHSSKFYATGERRIRLCVVTKKKLMMDYQTLYYARQFLAKLGYDDAQMAGLDSTIYNPTGYFAPVMHSDGSFVTDYDEHGQSLFIFQGKPFKWTSQKVFQKQAKKTENVKKLRKKAQFGKYGDFARRLLKLKNVQEALARSNGTITIVFKNIPEKTKGGYYINPEVDPWVVFHPNKQKKPFYINVKLGKKDFKTYKKYVLKRFRPPDPLKDLTTPDETITDNNPYLNPEVFQTKAPLLLIESPTGSGKTTQLANWMKEFDGSVLFISVNRAQAITTHKSLLNKGLDDFQCYIASDPAHKKRKVGKRYYRSEFIENVKQGDAPNRVICGILSLHHLIQEEGYLLRRYDVVVIDEITTLPRFAVSPVDLIGEEYLRFQQDMEALTELLRTADKIIGMDGYIARPVIDAFSEISQKKPYLIRKNFETKKKVEIYLTETGNEPNFKSTISCRKFISMLDKDIRKAKETGSVLVAAFTYKKKAQEVANYIKHCIPDAEDRIKLITGDTMENEGALNVIRELDSSLGGDISYLIYSPAITTGVDITQAENTNVYHIINGKQLSSHTHYQMTMRGRKAKSYKVLAPLFLADDSKSSFNPEKQFNHGLINLLYTVAFRKRYKIKILKIAVKDANLKMGSLLTFKYLETLKVNQKYLKPKEIITKLNNNQLKNLVSEESVKTAILLELAVLEWDNYDQKYGVLGQYINLLSREGCLVSKELDMKKVSKNDNKIDSEYYVKKYKNEIENILKYHGPIKSQAKSGLNNTIRRIKTGQRILNYILNNYKSKDDTVLTSEMLIATLKNHNLNLNTEIQKATNDDFIKIYDDLVIKIFSKKDDIEPEVYKRIKDGTNLTNRQKVTRVTYVLRLIFIVYRKDKNKPELTIKQNLYLLKSIENMDSEHKRYLYV
jgi:hypothetical protein